MTSFMTRIPQRIVPGNIMVFDVETTGLLPRGLSLLPSTVNQFPYIIQLSYILYNTRRKSIEQVSDMHVRIPSSVTLSPKITELTGITRQKCDSGIPILTALQNFYDAYQSCEWVVAHNIKFDRSMIRVELQRHADVLEGPLAPMSRMFDKTTEIPREYCTMFHGIDLCSIMVKSKAGDLYKKWPRLEELYNKLFPDELSPDGFHNAYIDMLVCLRCYLEMNKRPITKDKFHSLCAELKPFPNSPTNATASH